MCRITLARSYAYSVIDFRVIRFPLTATDTVFFQVRVSDRVLQTSPVLGKILKTTTATLLCNVTETTIMVANNRMKNWTEKRSPEILFDLYKTAIEDDAASCLELTCFECLLPTVRSLNR